MKKSRVLMAVAFIGMISACSMEAYAGPPEKKQAPHYSVSNNNYEVCKPESLLKDKYSEYQAELIVNYENVKINPVANISLSNIAYGHQSRFKAISNLNYWRRQICKAINFQRYNLTMRKGKDKTDKPIYSGVYDYGPSIPLIS